MRMYRMRQLFLVFTLLLAKAALSQMTQQIPLNLKWNGIVDERYGGDTLYYIALESAQYDGPMPTFVQSLPIYDDAVKVAVSLQQVTTAALSDEELVIAEKYAYSPDFVVDVNPLRSRDETFLCVRVVPFRQKG